MEVMMIGHSGSGKTTYMAAMYEIMNGGIEGFSVSAIDSADDAHFRKLGKRLRQRVYPTSSDILQEYRFSLRYDGREVIPFNWYDYRGAALLQRKDNSRDVAELFQRIQTADALIVFLDGDMLMKMDAQGAGHCRRIAFLIQSCISKLEQDRSFPISFVLTKGDKHFYDDLYKSPGMEVMRGVIELVAESENICGLTTVTEIGSDICNVELPFLFSMAFGIEGGCERARKERDRCERDKRYFEQKQGWWDDIKSKVFRETSYRERAMREARAARQKESILRELKDHLGNILSYIKRHDGENALKF